MIRKLYENVQLMKANNSIWGNVLYKINKMIVNLFYPILEYFNTKAGVDKESNVVVSLTTYPARIKTVWVTIASLLNQTYKPMKVVLYLSDRQFPNGRADLPKKLLQQENRGLEIVFVEDDLKPHKKYYYAFKEYRNNIVITADDDIFYPENHIECMVRAAKDHEDAVICNRSHKICIDDEAKTFTPYKYWKNNTTVEPDMLTLPVGCNGILYKPELFCDEVFSVENIKECALYTDDLWLKAMEIISGVKAYNYSNTPLVYFDNIFTMNTGLWHVNTNNDTSGNDVAWTKIIEAYPEVKKRIFSEEW